MPEPADYRAAFTRLDRPARRRVTRAVNLVRPLEDPQEAALAVATAGAQQRFWRRWWAAGPVLAALLRAGDGWEEMLGNALVAGIMFAGLAFFFSRRAGRAAAVNGAVVEAAASRKKSSRKSSKKARPRSKRGKRRR